MAMFPVLQWFYRNDVSKREGIPQLAYGLEGTFTPMSCNKYISCDNLTIIHFSLDYIFIGCSFTF